MKVEPDTADKDPSPGSAARFLDSILEFLPAMVFVKRASDLRFERFNRAGEELLGLSRRALLGKTDYDLFPKDQADFFVEKDRKVARFYLSTGSGFRVPGSVNRFGHPDDRVGSAVHGRPRWLLPGARCADRRAVVEEQFRPGADALRAITYEVDGKQYVATIGGNVLAAYALRDENTRRR